MQKLSEVDLLKFNNLILRQQLLTSETQELHRAAQANAEKRATLDADMKKFAKDCHEAYGVDLGQPSIQVDKDTGAIRDTSQTSSAHVPPA